MFQSSRVDPSHMRATEKSDELFEKLCDTLGEKKKLADAFLEASNEVHTIDARVIYRQGFRDCITLLRWLGVL